MHSLTKDSLLTLAILKKICGMTDYKHIGRSKEKHIAAKYLRTVNR